MATEAPGAGLKPAVSVALCTWNGERYLSEQLRSICLQTYPPCEIVLSDDASTDGSVALARKIVEECAQEGRGLAIPLRLLVNAQPLRVTRNFQQAITSCRGDLVALSDQDDVWRPDKLAQMVDRFVRDPQLRLLHTDALLVDAVGASLGRTLFDVLAVSADELKQIHDGDAFDVLLRRNLVTGATVMLRRELAVMAIPFPVDWVHDEWLGAIAAATGKLDVYERPLIDYRQHAANQIGARRDSVRDLVGKLVAARGDTHTLRLQRVQSLVMQLSALGDAVAPGQLTKAQGKLEHQRVRTAFPASRWGRLLPVARETLTGRYGRYNRGWRAVVRDLLEAA